MNVNKVLLVGRLTADPILRSTKTGQNVASFSLATNRVWTDQNKQKQEQVEFHNIVVWGRQAEICSKFLIKGQMAFIEGRLQTRSYENKDGQKQKSTEVVAERVQFGPKPGGAPASGPEQGSSDDPAVAEIPTINIDEEIKPEDLPF